MRITTNGTTISGSLSEVLATLTHITQLGANAPVTANPVTTPEVTETAVTGEAGEVAAKAVTAEIHAGERVLTKDAAVTPVPVPKLTRDGVIKQAISDVKDLLSREYYASLGGDGVIVVSHVGNGVDFRMGGMSDRVDFFINASKGAVVAKLTFDTASKPLKNRTYETEGRAKCAPGDVFNEHIGKAIALRRALGLEVPVEYFEVEVRDRDDLAVGDVVRGDATGDILELTAEKRNPCVGFIPGKAFDLHNGNWIASSQVTLINDSARHTAPDLEVSRIIRH